MSIWNVINSLPNSSVQSSEWVEKRVDEYASHIFCYQRERPPKSSSAHFSALNYAIFVG